MRCTELAHPVAVLFKNLNAYILFTLLSSSFAEDEILLLIKSFQCALSNIKFLLDALEPLR